jgi:hypothetical protein
VLAAERWNAPDPVWWRPDGRSGEYAPLGAEQAAAIEAAIGANRTPGASR